MTIKLEAGVDYGRRSTARSIGNMTVVECEYGGGLTTPSHFHARPYFGFVVSGGYRESYRHRTLDFTRRSIAWHPAEERHVTVLPAAGLRVVRVELAGASRELPLPDEPTVLNHDAQHVGSRILSELRHSDELTPMVLDALVTEAAAALLRSPDESTGAPWLRRVHDSIHDSFTAPIALRDLAEEAGVHPAHLTRAFRRQFGCTIGEMIRQLRVDRARDLLAKNEKPQADIALELGFSSQSHFAVAFRRIVGMSPGAYRRARRSSRNDMLRS
jgi:AraC family transcriptional regulator